MRTTRFDRAGVLLLLLAALPALAAQERGAPGKQQEERPAVRQEQQHQSRQEQPQHQEQARQERPQQHQEQARQERPQQHQEQARQERPQQRQEQAKARQERPGQHQEQAKARQERPGQHQEQARAQHEQPRAGRPEAPRGRPGEQAAYRDHRAHDFRSEHRDWQQRGGYHGYRIPEGRFRDHFGEGHGFRMSGYPMRMYGGHPRFQYGGVWLNVLDPWPEFWGADWYHDDDVYIGFSGGGYYLFNRSYPGSQIALSVSL